MRTSIVLTLIARILLGLVFLVLGLNGFLFFIKAPLPAGVAGEFNRVMFASHYNVMVFGVQIIVGLLLLLNRYIALALVVVAALLVNILTYHITMQPAGLPLPLIVTLLWFVVCWSVRFRFAPLLAAKA